MGKPMDSLLILRDIAFKVRAEGSGNVLTFRGTTETVASDGGVVLADGADFSRFEAGNAAVLWNHGMGSDVPVIGKAIAWRFDAVDRAWDFDILFAVEESDLAARVFRMAKAGFIVAASIGFHVTERIDAPTPEQQQQYGLGQWGWIATKWTLHELSLVPVGADPNALKRAVAAGVINEDDTEMARESDIITRADATKLVASLDALAAAVSGLHTLLAQPEDDDLEDAPDQEAEPEGEPAPAEDEKMDPPADGEEPVADGEDDDEEMPEDTGRGAKPKTPSAAGDVDEEAIMKRLDALRDDVSRLRGHRSVSGNPQPSGRAR